MALSCRFTLCSVLAFLCLLPLRAFPQGQQHVLSTAPESGPAYPWEGSFAGTNTGNGNKLTSVPLFSWTARGGLPVAFTLYHNSQGNHNSELGHKWTFSYDVYLLVDGSGNVTVHWGDDLSYAFARSGSSYIPPPGIYDTLVANGNPITSYDLTTRSQVKYRFTNPNGTGWYLSSITDLNGNAITLTRNAGNFVTGITDPTNRTITLAYANNRIASVTDPLNRQWTFQYNGSGDLTQITFPPVGGNSYSLQFGYNANHCITTLTDRRGNNWTFGYNSDNSLAWQKDPLQNQTSFSYAFGQTTITDPNGKTTRHLYDTENGWLSGETDALNYTESYQYDSNYNRTQVTDRRGKVWSYTYDNRGNVLTVTNPLNKTVTYAYNTRNQVVTVSSPMGNQVVNTYDASGNLTQTQRKNSGGQVVTSLSFGYNSHGLMISKTDSNNHTTTYGYNTHGHLISVTTPNNRVTSFGVNTLGVLTSRTDAMNRTTSYTLDNWLRVVGADYPTGTDPTFSYDSNDNLIGWTDAHGTWLRSYDAANRLITEKLNNVTRFSYAYDATGKKGQLSALTDTDGRVITLSYTSRGQLYQVSETAGTTTYGYDANGMENSVTNPNGTTVSRTFDNAGRLTQITHKSSGGVTLSSFSYGYNDEDLCASVVEKDGSTVTYVYDGAGRLISETRTGTYPCVRTYVLDGVNRISQTVNGVTTSFAYSADDELIATSGGFVNSYSYNANGEQTGRILSGVTYSLTYDYDGQLTQITQGANTTSYSYDALGRRISRTSGGVTTQFLTDPVLGRIWLEKQGATTTAVYAYGNALIRKDGEVPLFDASGSTRVVTNASQTVTGTITYEGFGQTIGTTGSVFRPYRFGATSGYRDDGDAGLLHVGARYYDPQVGRFITRDTCLDQKPYLYCEHDPVNFIDPSGHGLVSTLCSITGGVIGGILFGPPGAAIGAGLGTFFGDLYEGATFQDAALDGLVSGVFTYFGGRFVAKIGPWWQNGASIGTLPEVTGPPVGYFIPPKTSLPTIRTLPEEAWRNYYTPPVFHKPHR